MKNIVKLSAVLAAVTVLTACQTTMTSTRFLKPQLKTLTNGQPVLVSYNPPPSNYHCTGITTTSENWQVDRLKGAFHFNFLEYVVNKAVAFGSRLQPKPNFIYIDIPKRETHIGGINIDMMKNATTIYYRCQGMGLAK